MEACGKALNVLPKAMKMNEDAQSCCVACESIACFAPCEFCVLLYGIYKLVSDSQRDFQPKFYWPGNEHDNSDGAEDRRREDDSKTQVYV